MDVVYLLGIFAVLFGAAFALDRYADYKEKKEKNNCCGGKCGHCHCHDKDGDRE